MHVVNAFLTVINPCMNASVASCLYHCMLLGKCVTLLKQKQSQLKELWPNCKPSATILPADDRSILVLLLYGEQEEHSTVSH